MPIPLRLTLPRHLRASDLRGLARLAVQGTAGVTRVAEGLHQSVWSTLGVPGGALPGQTRGLTGLVYRGVRGVTRLAGTGVDGALAALQPLLESGAARHPPSARREALLAALNGVLGDHLAATGNPLATPMHLRYRGQALDWQTPPPLPGATAKVLLLVHGLCMNDLQWCSNNEAAPYDHGAALAARLGYTPVYVRYNTGLHTSQNGRALSRQLEQLLAHWPVPLEELSILTHSMGGLVARAALHCAGQEALGWPGALRHLVFLGTPHQGAPLERAGHWLDLMLQSTRYSAPFARLGQLRSAGITDLRYGHVRDEDWQGHDRFHGPCGEHPALPLPETVACFTVAATTAARRSTLADRLVGDGLVPLRSALGLHDQAQQSLRFGQDAQWIAYCTNHMQLLSSPTVGAQVAQWLGGASGRTRYGVLNGKT